MEKAITYQFQTLKVKMEKYLDQKNMTFSRPLQNTQLRVWPLQSPLLKLARNKPFQLGTKAERKKYLCSSHTGA